MADTTNYGWTKPTVGGDTGAWGGILNTLFDDADGDLKAVDDVAAAALPVAGGTMTGPLVNKNDKYVLSNKGTMTGAVELDLADANFFYGTKSGAVTFTFSNPATSGQVSFFMLEITNGGSAGAITWPSGVKWPGGSVALTASGVDLLIFYTRDAGTTWRGALAMENSS